MSSFKVDLDELSSYTQDLLKVYMEYDEEQRSFYKILGTVDNAWNDGNTGTFLEILEADRKNNEELNSVVLNNCRIILDFRNDVCSLLARNGLSNPRSVSYNQYSVSKSVKELSDIWKSLDIYTKSVKEHFVTCDAKLHIEALQTSLNTIKNTLSDIKDDLNNISKGLENNVASAKKKINGFTRVGIKDNRLKYNWDTVSLLNATTYDTTYDNDFNVKTGSLDRSMMTNVTGGRDNTYLSQSDELNKSIMANVATPTVNATNAQLKAMENSSYDGVRAETVSTGSTQKELNADTSTVYSADKVAGTSGYNNSLDTVETTYIASTGTVNETTAGGSNVQIQMQGNSMGNVQGNNIENGEVLENFVLESSNDLGGQVGRENVSVQAGMLGTIGAVGIARGTMNDDALETNGSFTINNNMDYSKTQNNNENARGGHLNNNQGYDGVNISQEKVDVRTNNMNTQSGLQDVAIQQNSEYSTNVGSIDLQSGIDSVSISGHEDLSNLGQTFKSSKLNADIDKESYKADFDGINQGNFN